MTTEGFTWGIAQSVSIAKAFVVRVAFLQCRLDWVSFIPALTRPKQGLPTFTILTTTTHLLNKIIKKEPNEEKRTFTNSTTQ